MRVASGMIERFGTVAGRIGTAAGHVGAAPGRFGLVTGRGVTLGNLMERLASVHGDRRMVEEAGPDGLCLTFREAADRVARMAATLAELVEPGDRVALALPNTYDLLLASLAVSRAGAVPVPLNSELRPKEVEAVADDAGATLVVHS